MAQTLVDLDRKIARSSGLPAFLQRHIQFKEATGDDRPSIVSYSSKSTLSGANSNNKQSVKNQKQVLHDRSTLLLEWPSVGRVGSGLRNMGNTCFLNSVLQCLLYSVPLNQYLMTEHRRSCVASINHEHCMLCELHNTFRSMLSAGQAQCPSGIVSRLKGIARHFKPGRQEDAHEFLRYFIDTLQKSALYGVPQDTAHAIKETNVVQSVFGGKLRSSIICAKCGHRSTTNDPFMDVSLDVKVSDSIDNALQQFCRREALSKSNKYKCEACKELSEASKQMQFERLPAVLTLHLKRFSHTLFGTIGKIHKHVDFTADLDMTPYMASSDTDSVSGGNKYRLFGVVVHDGHSTHSGHYYSFIRASNHMWYCMNDESVSQVSLNTVLRQKAYILFYSAVPSAPAPATPSACDMEAVINVEECSDATSIARSNSMWHMTSSPVVGARVGKKRHHGGHGKDKRIKWRISKCEQ